jgi:hypothetical protein
MTNNTSEFTVKIDDSDIMEQVYEIIKRTPKYLTEIFSEYDTELRKYAKAELDMINKDDAAEYCGGH